MKLQDIYQHFEQPPLVQLGKPMTVCYVLSVLLERGNSYGTELIQCLDQEYARYCLSDTILYSALKFLKKEGVIESYWLNTVGRGRPRRMYQVNPAKLELATQLANLWQKYQAKQTENNSSEQRQTS